jgi:hypothetical protein
LIDASEFFGKRCNQLWTESNGHIIGEDAEVWDSMIFEPRFDQYMKHCHFKDFRCFLPSAFQCGKLKEKGNPWWQLQWAIDQLNQLTGDCIINSSWIAFDESMSLWHPWTTQMGELPNISFNKRKPKPLGKLIIACLLFLI